MVQVFRVFRIGMIYSVNLNFLNRKPSEPLNP
jgi:hypothetical protein